MMKPNSWYLLVHR